MNVLKLAVIGATMCVSLLGNAVAADWSTAEGSCFKKGDINVGIGIPLFPFGVYAEGDYAFHDAISGGMSMGFTTYGFNDFSYNQIPILARGSFHPFNLTFLADKIKVRNVLDPYVGVAIGWRIGWSAYHGSLSGVSPDAVGGFNFREHIGARWYPVEKFYLFAEEGMGFGYINIGGGMKF